LKASKHYKLTKRFFSPAAIFIYLLSLAAIWSGCKESTIISSRLSPAGNQVYVLSDTLSCVTHTYLDDTTITSTNIGGLAIYQAVGGFTDPYFGTMTGATYFQIVPTDVGSAVLSGATIDSAILILPYGGFTYGDTLDTGATATYQVFYMTDTMSLNAIYYSYSTKSIDIYNPLSAPFTVNTYHLRDSFSAYPAVLPNDYPALHIPLKLPQLEAKLLPAQAITNSATPFQDFMNTFYGICVRSANSSVYTTAMPYYRLDGSSIYSEAGINVYYHLPSDTTSYIETYYFNTGLCAHFNNVTKSYSHYPINALYHSSAPNDSVVALQNEPGPSMDIYVPGIKSLPKGVINKAELQLSVLPYSNYAATLPYLLYPLGVGNGTYPLAVSAGNEYTLSDRYPITSITPLTVMDGYMHYFTYGSTTIPTFTVDMPREVIASIAAGNDTLHLHISGTEDYYGAFHLLAGGGSYGKGTADSIYRAKFVVTYSKLQ
jgi:Domain of unknown function (DUF4270)